jgi:dTDP-4-amino-4,6-dideoxygalactose transaminase
MEVRREAAVEAQMEQLAIEGGPKALESVEGRPRPKVGVDEFMRLAEIWGFNPVTLGSIGRAVAGEDLGDGPFLARYAHPGESQVDVFEAKASELFGVPYALAVHSGTSALEAAYVGCGIGPGDEVIVPGYTFFATASAVVLLGAVPVVCEVDESLTMDPVDLERKITPRTKAVVPVHMMGGCADMGPILEIAGKHGLRVIEDTAQACGASLRGRRLGTFGDAGCFSLSSYKPVGAGEAGLVVTSSEELHMRALNYHDAAACWRPDRYAKERFPGELFCGTNFRMSELEGAVNIVQLEKMDDQLDRFRRSKRHLLSHLHRYDGITPRLVHDFDGEVANHVIFFAPSTQEAGVLADALAAEGLDAWCYGLGEGKRDWHIYAYWEHILERKTASPAGCPWNCPSYSTDLPEYSEDMCPRTLDLLGRAVMVMVSQWWTENDAEQAAGALNKVLGAFHGRTDAPWVPSTAAR